MLPVYHLIWLGGEAWTSELLDSVRELTNARIFNMYGPTETTIWSSSKDVTDEKVVTIGRPISNTKIYILDKYQHICPIGVPGELCIAGDGLARGYLNRLELTAEKFIENSFEPGTKMYKTGDLARWMSDGNIEFLGRIDHQVKIRGYRIELGEIENRLLELEGITEAVVTAREDQSANKFLCVYTAGEKEFSITQLREHILEELPEYMVPSYFVQLERLPLTSSGKIDRKALPAPDVNMLAGKENEAPRNELEVKLVEIWKEVLGVERIGINDNFFELGGHSLKATGLMAKIHKQLNVEVPINEIFKTATIKAMAEYIKGAEENIYSSIEAVEDREYYNTSSAQKRVYALQQFNIKSTTYNIPEVMEVEGELNREKLENTFKKLIERHESLRTSFEIIEEKIVQKISKETDFKIEYQDGTGKTEEEIKGYIKSFIRVFELNKAPLIRVGIIKVSPERHIMIMGGADKNLD